MNRAATRKGAAIRAGEARSRLTRGNQEKNYAKEGCSPTRVVVVRWCGWLVEVLVWWFGSGLAWCWTVAIGGDWFEVWLRRIWSGCAHCVKGFRRDSNDFVILELF